MAKSIKKTEVSAAAQISNISEAAMKVILSKISASSKPNPGGDNSVFVKGPTDFAQDGSFYKFSRPGDKTPLVSIEHTGGFKINAESIKAIEQQQRR